MLVTNVTLYKTPLDNSYDNVFDIEYFNTEIPNNPDYKSIYAQAIEQMYGTDKIEVVLPRFFKSLKLEDNKTVITLPYNQLDIRDYNYIKIDDKWFFITNTVSENDSVNETTPPSVTLYLEWDAWANNIDKDIIRHSTVDVIRRHFERYDYEGRPLYYNNTETNQINHEITNIETTGKMLWAKITFNENFDINNFLPFYKDIENKLIFESSDGDFNYVEQSTFNKITLNDILPYKQNRQVIYIPMGLVNRLGEFVNPYVTQILDSVSYLYARKNTGKTIELTGQEFENGSQILENFVYDIPFFSFVGNNTEYVESIEYTFYSPYKYDVTGNYDVIFRFPFVKLDIGLGFNVVLPFIPSKVWGNVTRGDTVIIAANAWNVTRYVAIESFNNFYEEINIDYNTIFPTRFNTGIYEVDNLDDPKLKLFPYNYLTVVLNGEEINISPQLINERSFTFIVDKNYKNQPIFYYKSDMRDNIIPKGVALENSGGLSYSIRALDQYMINNGSQKRANYINSQISNSLNLLSSIMLKNYIGAVKDISNIAGESVSYTAFFEDIKRRADIINKSDYAEDDYLYQDRVLLYSSTVRDTQSLYNKRKELYVYGYDNRQIGVTPYSTRFWFDYIQCSSIYIDTPINDVDKKIIIQMFKRGFFRFHINVTNTGIIVDKYLSKDGSLNNIERSIATL